MVSSIFFISIVPILYLNVFSMPLLMDNNKNTTDIKSEVNLKTTLMDIEDTANKTMSLSEKRRAKRQGAGKYQEAAKMPQTKLMQLVLQMFRNLWDPIYVGGRHPMHPDIPRAFVSMCRHKIGQFLFPEVGKDAKFLN